MTDLNGKLLAAVLVAVTLFVSPSQSQETTKAATTETVTADEIRSEISEAFDAIGTYSVQQRDEAMARAEETLAEVDAEIDQLEDRTWGELE